MTSKSPLPRALITMGILAAGAVAVLVFRTWDPPPPSPEPVAAPAPVEPRPVAGVLRVSLHGTSAAGVGSPAGWTQLTEPVVHTGTWVNGPSYRGQTENDIRGFLDGRFRYAFNQESQIHTRVGRVGPPARAILGERELLRTLYRWAEIQLPTNARIEGARFELPVEDVGDEQRPSDVFLYLVHKDWIPGDGGVARDNFSEPADGEVWWNEAMRDSVPWGLPGAGFASDADPEADTPVTPLGFARFRPGDSLVVFESEALASYVQDRVSDEEPLLFLLKLSDYQEDTEGTIFPIYSSDHGDSRNTDYRPRLMLEWQSSGPGRDLERPVVLEYGRSLILPRVSTPGLRAVSASFLPQAGTAIPRIMIRGGSDGYTSEWIDASIPLVENWEWIEIRLDGFENPTPLGQTFKAGFRDTWIPEGGAPEEHEVHWAFVSPSGAVHEVRANYLGDFTWEVEFAPDEVGRWVYQWRHDFVGTPYRSPVGRLDVIVESREAGIAALERLIGRIQASELAPGAARIEAFGPAFIRLERAILQFESPATFPMRDESPGTARLGNLLDAAREALSGTRPEGPRLPLGTSGP